MNFRDQNSTDLDSHIERINNCRKGVVNPTHYRFSGGRAATDILRF